MKQNEPFGYNYHSHTYRCGHARGQDEEYVLRAIDGGYKLLGFSDHVMLPGKTQRGMRGDFSESEGYFRSVNALKEKYKDQIVVYRAFECEYYPKYVEYYRGLLDSGTVDYLLLGQHCFLDEYEDFSFYGDLAGDGSFGGPAIQSEKEAVTRYRDDLITGMKSGLFLYVAHPDLFFIFYHHPFDDFMKEISLSIIKTAVELDIPLELNMGPSRWGRKDSTAPFMKVAYPNDNFWALASKFNLKIVVGVDSHDPNDLLDSPFSFIRDFIQRHNLKLMDGGKVPWLIKK